MKILVTGGAGFIGSNLLVGIVPRFPEHRFVNVDKLGYAANLANLAAIEGCNNYVFEHCDLADRAAVEQVFARHTPDAVIHLAAESHVDRSIAEPGAFMHSNVLGTFHLLEACRSSWSGGDHVFHHVSTDEVFGSLGDGGYFDETTRYDPSSPYSASKAAADHLVRAYHRTFGLPVKISNCSNNYGPRQFPEKLIPLMILNALERKPLPVYGAGINVRDWIYVEDHCDALWHVFTRGRIGESYLVGGRSERTNLEVVQRICQMVAEETGGAGLEGLITFISDRPGHDLRYAIDPTRVETELGWKPRETFESGLRKTVRWYIENAEWVSGVRTGAYRAWIAKNYEQRT